MRRELTNPNTTTKPIEITVAEVARVAKTGCSVCHGAGSIVFAEKKHRGQTKANGERRLCRCVADLVRGRQDVTEVGGKLCWRPVQAQP